MLYTTLDDIKKHNPCESGWKKLLKSLGKTESDSEKLSFKSILESNGLEDSLWCLRALKDNDKEIRLFAVWCARQVEHLDKSGVSERTNDMTERFTNSEATQEEWAAASAAVWAAARVAARAAAWNAAWDAQKEEFIKRFCTEE